MEDEPLDVMIARFIEAELEPENQRTVPPPANYDGVLADERHYMNERERKRLEKG